MGSVGTQQATNAVFIENMNEQQIDAEINKTEKRINQLNKILEKNDITNSAKAKALADAFPLGVGGDGWTDTKKKAKEKDLVSDVKKAKKYTDAYDEKKALQTKLNSLQKAKKEIAGTGKTQKQLQEEKLQKLASNPTTLKWKTTQKSGWVNGAYYPKIIKSGNMEIHGSDGFFTIYKDGVKIGSTQKLSVAKGIAEKYKDK